MIHSIMQAGTFREEFYAQSSGTDIITVAGTWHPVTIPAGKKFNRMLIQCVKETPTFDYDIDLTSFRFSNSATGPGLQVPRTGYPDAVSFGYHETDTIVGYVLAPAGYKIVVFLMG